MDQQSQTRPSHAASSSSGRSSCYLFGVELVPTNPLVENENEGMDNDASRKGKAVASDALALASPETIQFSEFPLKGKLQITGSTSGTNMAEAVNKNAPIFPKNVRSLLLTGIFDGIFVACGGSSRENDNWTFAMIDGTRFVCACLECNGLERVSARKLARHSGYETSHATSGIYFASGYSIFQAVGKLQKTPREKLYEEIRSITRSRVNEEYFMKLWRALASSGNEV